jgi:hypothetical protein
MKGGGWIERMVMVMEVVGLNSRRGLDGVRSIG